MTSRADKIRARMERDTAALANADKADVLDANRDKLGKAIATTTVLKIVKAIGAAVTLTIAESGEVTIKGSGGSGEKAPSLSRLANVTAWVVDGEVVESPMASRLLAALHGIDPQDTKAIRALYKKDSPQRVIRKEPTLAMVKAHKVKAIVDGKRIDAHSLLTA